MNQGPNAQVQVQGIDVNAGAAARASNGPSGDDTKPNRATGGHNRGIFERPSGSGMWWVRYADAAGREHREKAGTKGMALKLYRKRKTEAIQGRKLPETINRRPVSVRELLDAAVAHVQDHYSTVRYAAKTGQPAKDSRYPALAKVIGDLAAESLTPVEIERVLSKLATDRKWSPATVNRHQAFLSLAFRLGVQNGHVAANPCRAVRRRREDNGRIRWLDAKEEAKLRAVIRQHFPAHEPEFDLALNTGLRQANQYGLQWPDVDFERRHVVVDRAKNGRPHYAPLNQAAIDALLKLRAAAGESQWVIVNAATGKGRYRGKPRRTPRNWFEAAVTKVALKDFTWHCLRHTFCSRLVMAGVDIRTVAELMGHRTLAMTMRYSHLAPQHKLDAVCLLDGWERRSGIADSTPTGTRTGTEAESAVDDGSHGLTQVLAVQ